jgi:hypothetical protein
MKDLFKRIFIDHWQRKTISLLLAIGTWFLVHHSMTSTKIVSNVLVKVINLPTGKTIEGLLPGNILHDRISLGVTGNKHFVDELTNQDIEVILDASNKGDEWIATISKKNLICFNPDIDIMQTIQKVDHKDFIIKLCPMFSACIPVNVSVSSEELLLGYRLLDVWPREFFITLTGSEKKIHEIEKRGLQLNLNLNNISPHDLIVLQKENSSEVISYCPPPSWKFIDIPELFDLPVQITDPQVEKLRIDFVQDQVYSLGIPLPVHLFYSSSTLPSSSLSLKTTPGVVEEKQGTFFYLPSLFVRGVSHSFLHLIQNHLELVLFPSEKNWRWTIDIVGKQELLKKFIHQEKTRHPKEADLDEYLFLQFQKSLNSLHFYQNNDEKLELEIHEQDQKILITPKKAHL